jgi:hypothetical protein
MDGLNTVPIFLHPFELVCFIYDSESIIIVRQLEMVGFKGEQQEMPPRGLHKVEIESTDFVEIFAPKNHKNCLRILVIIRNKKKKSFNPDSFLLIEGPIY